LGMEAFPFLDAKITWSGSGRTRPAQAAGGRERLNLGRGDAANFHLLRAVPCAPPVILTAARETFKRSASKRQSASFARSSTGGAVRANFQRAHPISPAIVSRLARGCTRTLKLTVSPCSLISIGISLLLPAAARNGLAIGRAADGQKWPYRAGPGSAPSSIAVSNRATSPWRVRAMQSRGGAPGRPEFAKLAK